MSLKERRVREGRMKEERKDRRREGKENKKETASYIFMIKCNKT